MQQERWHKTTPSSHAPAPHSNDTTAVWGQARVLQLPWANHERSFAQGIRMPSETSCLDVRCPGQPAKLAERTARNAGVTAGYFCDCAGNYDGSDISGAPSQPENLTPEDMPWLLRLCCKRWAKQPLARDKQDGQFTVLQPTLKSTMLASTPQKVHQFSHHDFSCLKIVGSQRGCSSVVATVVVACGCWGWIGMQWQLAKLL